MKLLGSRQLSLLLVFTLLLCHGIFGALHLVCYPPQCAGDAEHAADHQLAAGAVSGAHEHPAGHHGTSIEYFAVLVFGVLSLLLGVLLKGGYRCASDSARIGPRAFAWRSEEHNV